MADDSRFDPLRSESQMVALIAEASGVPNDVAMRRLHLEMVKPGSSVAVDFAERGGARYEASPEMDAFYGATDAFLYELAVWNRNRMKSGMRRWIARDMSRRQGLSTGNAVAEGDRSGQAVLKVLSIGDGLGFDCLHWQRQGHRVTYFELPGISERFARNLFAKVGADIPMLTDPAAIPHESFDAITCLDVLEHVPDVPALAKTLASYLRPGGVMYVSAPYFLILPAYPTHLRKNRRFSGSLAPYRAAGLELVGGRPGWDPIVLRKPGGSDQSVSKLGTAAVQAGRLLWLPGRFAAWPYIPLQWIRKLGNRPFA